jgi:predicted HTH domain antitoxin
MSGHSLTLQLPEVLAEELRSANQDFLLEVLERGLRELRIERALALYARGGMTFGAAAERAGVSQPDLARHAYARGLEPPCSAETLSEELGRPS